MMKRIAAALLGALLSFLCFAPEAWVLSARRHLPVVSIRAVKTCDDASKAQAFVSGSVKTDAQTFVAFDGRKIQRYTLTGHLDERPQAQLDAALADAEARGITDIELLIDSDGGNTAAGFHMAGALARSKINLHCLVGAQAMSSAFMVLQGCDDRAALPTSKLMEHRPFAWIPKPTVLQAERMIEIAQSLLESRTTMARLLAARSQDALGAEAGLTEDVIAERLSHGDWVMSPTEAILFGLLDRAVVDFGAFQASVER